MSKKILKNKKESSKYKISNNSSLSKHYDKIFTKGEHKHFTTFVAKGKPSLEATQVLQQVNWKKKKV